MMKHFGWAYTAFCYVAAAIAIRWFGEFEYPSSFESRLAAGIMWFMAPVAVPVVVAVALLWLVGRLILLGA
jgi:hypothetical protein